MGKEIGRRRGVGAAVATLALALLVPASAFAYDGLSVDVGPLNVQRDCGAAEGFLVGDAQGQCSYNIAQPSADQDASAKAIEGNGALTLQGNAQKQINIQAPDASVTNFASVGGAPVNAMPATDSVVGGYFGGGISPEAVAVVESGGVGVSGHDANIDMEDLEQEANAGPHGDIIVSNFTGGVSNYSDGTNVAVANAGALNNTNSGLFGFAQTDADDAVIGGDGGWGTGNWGGDGPEASHFGVDGGFGGSNINAALGLSGAAGGDGGSAGSTGSQVVGAPMLPGDESAASEGFPIFCNTCGGGLFGLLGSRNGEAESWASANGGNGSAGTGASASATQTAGDGGAAWFQLNGSGGAASGDNYAYGGAGTLTNSNSVGGTATATGAAQGGTTGWVYSGNVQEANTGQNDTTANMNGGIAGNSLGATITQSDPVTGYSGAVTNSGSPSVCAGITINQGSSPSIDMTNAPSQTAGNTASTSQSAASGAQTVSPFQSVTTGAQTAANLGAQDSFRAVQSGNTDNSNQGNDYSNQGNLTNNGRISVEFEGLLRK